MTIAAFAAFVGLCALLCLTPGPDTLLVLRYSVRRARTGITASFGCTLGVLVWSALVGFGLAALIEQSAELFRALKVIGGLYLLFLGVQAIRHSRRAGEAGQAEVDAVASPGRPRTAAPTGASAFVAGLLSSITNPKVGLFFLAIVPQFLPRDGSVFGTALLLGLVLAAVELVYLVALAAVAAKATVWLKRPRVAGWIERISGGILAALGIGTAASALEA
jgi:threonine/homoserine/homoserine lactone efflux protein